MSKSFSILEFYDETLYFFNRIIYLSRTKLSERFF
jgi:hypothetical protein